MAWRSCSWPRSPCRWSPRAPPGCVAAATSTRSRPGPRRPPGRSSRHERPAAAHRGGGGAGRRLGPDPALLRGARAAHPSAHSPGGARRYAEEDLARLARIRELKDLLGFNLDEVRTVLTAEDRLGSLRAAYHAEDDRAAQRAIVAEALEINSRLQAAVQAKLERLATFKGELEAKADRYSASLAGLQPPSDAGVPG